MLVDLWFIFKYTSVVGLRVASLYWQSVWIRMVVVLSHVIHHAGVGRLSRVVLGLDGVGWLSACADAHYSFICLQLVILARSVLLHYLFTTLNQWWFFIAVWIPNWSSWPRCIFRLILILEILIFILKQHWIFLINIWLRTTLILNCVIKRIDIFHRIWVIIMPPIYLVDITVYLLLAPPFVWVVVRSLDVGVNVLLFEFVYVNFVIISIIYWRITVRTMRIFLQWSKFCYLPRLKCTSSCSLSKDVQIVISNIIVIRIQELPFWINVFPSFLHL